jgi:hypothetical protein
MRWPATTTATRNPAAIAKVVAIPATLMAPPAARPDTTPRMTSPTTSSSTAAPRMIRASGVSMAPRSPNTRAVIPTDVAVSVAPMKIATVPMSPPSPITG